MSTTDPTRVDPADTSTRRLRRLAAAAAEPRGRGRRAGEARPRATRVPEGAVLGGVCTGLARHLGWPVLVIRIGFVGLAAGPVHRRDRVRGAVVAAAARAGQRGARARGGDPARDARVRSRPSAAAGLGDAAGAWPRSAPACCGSCRPAVWGSASSCSGRWPSRARAPPWSGGRPTPLSRSAGGPRRAARSGWRRSWPGAAGRRSSGSCSASGWWGRPSGWSSRSRTSCSSCPR